MRDKTLIPTNLLSWPKCGGLLPDQRLILLWLWACPYLSSAGCGLVPLPAAAATLGLDVDAFRGGLDTLVSAGLIEFEKETGELFIVDWFRFHTFKSSVAKRCFDSDLKKVQSQRLKNMIAEKSKTCFPTATATATATTTRTVSCMHQQEGRSAPQKQPAPDGAGAGACKKKTLENGVVCWSDDDRLQVQKLIDTCGQELVSEAAKKMAEEGIEPLPSRVSKILKGQNHGKPEWDNIRNEEEGASALAASSLQYYADDGERQRQVIDGERIT